ncbi:hypothetical protein QYF36_019614 [Acer negundo]|nr:hypothetical protein QYF36_019614 [Acer negundo]
MKSSQQTWNLIIGSIRRHLLLYKHEQVLNKRQEPAAKRLQGKQHLQQEHQKETKIASANITEQSQNKNRPAAKHSSRLINRSKTTRFF